MITIEQARQYYAGADAVHDFDHVLRVLALAEQLALAEGADLEIVRTAALLHDVARGWTSRKPPAVAEGAVTATPGGEGLDHAQAGAEFARQLLTGYPPERVEAVAQAIAAHRFRSGPAPESIEARVLHDADKLDAIGAIGVARAFAFGGHEGQRLWAEVPAGYSESAATRHEHTPVHEYHLKLIKIQGRLLTDSARQIARARHAFMVDFFEHLEREVQGLA